MENRPKAIDVLSAKVHDGQRSGQPSPRIVHQEGEVPPELSPLDAFLAQGRLLAKQLDDGQRDGKRMSRLPPLAIANSLANVRPGYFRSFSVGTSLAEAEHSSDDDDTFLTKPALTVPDHRPASMHPRLSGMSASTAHDPMPPSTPRDDIDRGRLFANSGSDTGTYFGVRREQSPETIAEEGSRTNATEYRPSLRQQRSFEPPRRQLASMNLGLSKDSTAVPSNNNANALAPPRSPFSQQTSSIRSVPADVSDDETPAVMGASFTSIPSRKPSSSSMMSASTSSLSPSAPAPPRSPSISSEYSVGGSHMPRPSYNFSRPLSRASRPSFEAPSRQASSDSQPYMFVDDTVHTPVSINSEEYTAENLEGGAGPAPSLQTHQSFCEDPFTQQSNLTPTINSNMSYRPPSPPSPPRLNAAPVLPSLSNDRRPSSSSNRQARSISPSQNWGTSASRGLNVHSTCPSVSSASTIKPQSFIGSLAGSSIDMTPEEHVTKGIECHEAGSLKESTYHLRLAARANHPTGMLMYALACRHGWGMRPNQREGVEWLRRAVDCASLEVAEDEDLVQGGATTGPVDYVERKTRRAQFALSIYELGVSHMNGWGIEQDKALALRCFEIAGAWGDGDALAEAGFCYAQGIGCKKDLKKSARLYRQAESKGISMVGNSWIYKSKYNEEDSAERRGRAAKLDKADKAAAAVNGKEKRDKSRTKSIFGRKKSIVPSS